MTRIPRVCLVLAVIALFTLLMVPMAGARTLSSPSIHLVNGGWLDAAVRWVEDFAGLRPQAHPGHSGAKAPMDAKEDANFAYPAGGGCIDPLGRPRPSCP